MDIPTKDEAVRLNSISPISAERILILVFGAVMGLHVLLLIVLQPDPVIASRLCTAAAAVLAVMCALWRAMKVPPSERSIWLWSAAGIFLWATAHAVETFIGNPNPASNLAIDQSDFIYVIAAFPLLTALSTTQGTKSVRTILYLNCAQIALAVVLTYCLLYWTSMAPETASTIMQRIYAVECVFLVVVATLRLFIWETMEERRSLRLICVFLWTYLPIEIGMDYATEHWRLRAGNLEDLFWSVPFMLAGWQAVTAPIDGLQSTPSTTPNRWRLLLETQCPMLLTLAIFLLAAFVSSQHPLVGFSAIFLLLILWGLQSGALQLNYIVGRNLLLEQGKELRVANAALERLSLIDPLTSIPNRRRFAVALDEVWRRAVRKDESVALLSIDIDFFKGANDLHSHAYGDKCITAVAQVLDRQAGRPYDLLARYGGDEFFLLLPDTGSNGAIVVADRIHGAIHVLRIENRASLFDGLLTVSIGIGVLDPKPGQDPASLVEMSDRALYEAKGLGRNRTALQKP